LERQCHDGIAEPRELNVALVRAKDNNQTDRNDGERDKNDGDMG
jgi:hypothetical protein